MRGDSALFLARPALTRGGDSALRKRETGKSGSVETVPDGRGKQKHISAAFVCAEVHLVSAELWRVGPLPLGLATSRSQGGGSPNARSISLDPERLPIEAFIVVSSVRRWRWPGGGLAVAWRWHGGDPNYRHKTNFREHGHPGLMSQQPHPQSRNKDSSRIRHPHKECPHTIATATSQGEVEVWCGSSPMFS
jgi:hypothetical protein